MVVENTPLDCNTFNKMVETVAELKNWPKLLTEIAVKQDNWRVMPLVNIWLASHAAGAFATEAKEIPSWFYRTPNDKPKNQSHALQPNTLV